MWLRVGTLVNEVVVRTVGLNDSSHSVGPETNHSSRRNDFVASPEVHEGPRSAGSTFASGASEPFAGVRKAFCMKRVIDRERFESTGVLTSPPTRDASFL